MRRHWWRAARSATLVAMIIGSVLAAGGWPPAPAQAAGCSDLASPFQTLSGCNLAGANIGATLALAGSSLRFSNLNRATISGQGALVAADLRLVAASQATISGAEALDVANLEGVNLAGVNISVQAALVAANLEGVSLYRATIAGRGDLLAANLHGAILRGATISGTGALTGADLSYADLTGAAVTGKDALFDAHFDHTICPDGSLSDHDGGTCAGHLSAASAVESRPATLIAPAVVPCNPCGGGGGGSGPTFTPPPGRLVATLRPAGGLDLNAYCQAHGFSGSLNYPTNGTDAAFQWFCDGAVGSPTTRIVLQNACSSQYAGSIAFIQNPTDATSWVCLVPSSGSGFVRTATDGSTYLGLPGGTGVALVDVTDGTFQVASLGSVATGGVVFIQVGPEGTIDFNGSGGGFQVASLGSVATGGVV